MEKEKKQGQEVIHNGKENKSGQGETIYKGCYPQWQRNLYDKYQKGESKERMETYKKSWLQDLLTASVDVKH